MSNKRRTKFSLAGLNKGMFIINILLFSLFLILQITITSVIGTKSSEIDSIRRTKDDVRLEIEILQSKIDQAKSYKEFEEVIEIQSLEQKPIVYVDPSTNEVALN